MLKDLGSKFLAAILFKGGIAEPHYENKVWTFILFNMDEPKSIQLHNLDSNQGPND